jgi:hypothetical protein
LRVIRFFSLFSAIHFIAAFYETRKRFVNLTYRLREENLLWQMDE